MSKKNEDFKAQNYNAKRSSKIAYLSRKNFEMSKQIRTYLEQNKNLSKLQAEHLNKLDKNISSCAYHSLYRVGERYETTYIASHTCDNRNCNICNYIRQKKIRRAYLRFFKKNKYLYQIQNIKTKKNTTVTANWYNKSYKDNLNYKLVDKIEYDLMHLTLTVPHYSDTGFRGKKFYYSEIIKLFNEMRKSKKKVQLTDFLTAQFTDFVLGGEYGVETTKTDNGLNIHIHSLVFVKKYKRSRDLTHKLILKLWNSYTVNEYSQRKQFTEKHIGQIKKGNKLLTADWIKKELNPQGATLIGLETIYSLQDGQKVRSKEFYSDDMIKAVMETISYHFEPQAFEKKHNEFNMNLLSELLPAIFKQRLYGRFGCLYREPELNFKYKKFNEEYEDIKVDTETGEIEFAEHYIITPYRVFHDKDNGEQIKIGKKTLEKAVKIDALSTPEALSKMTEMYRAFKIRGN